MEYLPPVDYQKEVHFAPAPGDMEKLVKEGVYLKTAHAFQALDAGTPDPNDVCDNPYITCDVETNPNGTFILTVSIDGRAQVNWDDVCATIGKKAGMDLTDPDCSIWLSGGSNGWGSTTESGLTFGPEKIVYEAPASGNYSLPNGDSINLMAISDGINANATETAVAAANEIPTPVPANENAGGLPQGVKNVLNELGVLACIVILGGGGIAYIWYRNAPGYVADEKREQKEKIKDAQAKVSATNLSDKNTQKNPGEVEKSIQETGSEPEPSIGGKFPKDMARYFARKGK